MLTKPLSSGHGEATAPPAKTASKPGAVLTRSFHTVALRFADDNKDFDALAAELESEPANAAELAEAGAWAADLLYPGETETLKTARLRKGLSQKQLAKMIGTSQPHIANLEKSGTDVMISTAQKLCAALEVDFGKLPEMIQRQREMNAQKDVK